MELNLARKAPEHLPAWGTRSMLAKALMVFSLLLGIGAALAQELRWNGVVGIFSATEPVRLDIGTAAVKKNVPASHNSWATRLVLRRLDGASVGPVSAAHVVGIFSEDGQYRLDIGTAAVKQNIPASHESWATRLRILRLDGANSGAVSYGEVVGIFSEDGKFRLDIGTDAMKQNTPASHESWATRLQVRSLEGAHTSAAVNQPPQAAPAGLADALVGQYENHRYDQGGKNDWHYVSITKLSDSVLRWTNRANVSWTLTLTPDRNVLQVGRDNPYFAQGYQQARVIWAGSTVARIFGPGEEPYDRKGARSDRDSVPVATGPTGGAPAPMPAPAPAAPPVSAANSARLGDIVWQHQSGQVHYWKMSNGQRLDGINIHSPVGADWRLIGAGDVDGDGSADLVWQHQSGQVHYWKMQGRNRVAGIDIFTPVGREWRLIGVQDLDGDGTADLLWQHQSGQVHYWKMQGARHSAGINISSPVGADWRLIGAGDVDGDGMADLIWQHQSGQVHYWKMQGARRIAGIDIDNRVGADWKLVGVGHINGDATADLLWQHRSGQMHYWAMQSGKRMAGIDISSPVGPDWRAIGAGRFD